MENIKMILEDAFKKKRLYEEFLNACKDDEERNNFKTACIVQFSTLLEYNEFHALLTLTEKMLREAQKLSDAQKKERIQ